MNLTGRFLELRGPNILLADPILEGPVEADGLAVGESSHLTFRHGDRKYTCVVTVLERTLAAVGEDPRAPAVLVCCPTAIRRVQRRACARHDLPEDLLASVQFWLGGKINSNESGIEGPIWSAKVVDLSRQGAKLQANRNHAKALDPGDCVGLRFRFGSTREAICLDAVCRYVQPFEPDSRKVMIGFHFVAPESSLPARQIPDMVRFWAAFCGK